MIVTMNSKPCHLNNWTPTARTKLDELRRYLAGQDKELDRSPTTIHTINYCTARPYKHEYSTGSNKSGFVYQITGSRDVHVATWPPHDDEPQGIAND